MLVEDEREVRRGGGLNTYLTRSPRLRECWCLAARTAIWSSETSYVPLVDGDEKHRRGVWQDWLLAVQRWRIERRRLAATAWDLDRNDFMTAGRPLIKVDAVHDLNVRRVSWIQDVPPRYFCSRLLRNPLMRWSYIEEKYLSLREMSQPIDILILPQL